MQSSSINQPDNVAMLAISWIGWATIHLWILVGLGIPVMTALLDSVVSNTLLAGACFLIALILRYYLPVKNRYLYLMIICLLEAALWYLVNRVVLFEIIPKSPDYKSFLASSSPVRFAVAFLILNCVALMNVILRSLRENKRQEERFFETEKLAREAELYKLRQQLQPHFLFNSLNSINALVTSQPEQARTMIQQLSEFLRGTIRKEENNLSSLDEELRHLQLYLDIEKVRFGHRLKTDIQVDKECEKMKIPGLLLQPLVENAIKYGLYQTIGEVGILIRAQKTDRMLMVSIQNPYDPETHSADKGTGFGLRSVNRRLHLIFGRSDLLATEGRDHLFTTTVKIPQYD